MTDVKVSVFDAIESDTTGRREASRRALALAHVRVENHLGAFLRQASTEAEYEERLALVQRDFDSFVAEASAEVGHDTPQHIAAALKDHYRLAVHHAMVKEAPGKKHLPGHTDKENRQYEHIKDSYLEEGEDEEKAKELAARTVNKGRGKKKSGWRLEAAPVPEALSVGDFERRDPMMGQEMCPNCGNAMGPDGRCVMCGYSAHHHPHDLGFPEPNSGELERESDPRGWVASVEGKQSAPLGKTAAPQGVVFGQRPWEDAQGGEEGKREEMPYDQYLAELRGKGKRASEEQSHAMVICPECGGDGKTAGATKCPKCSGKGRVPNFGDSVLDALDGHTGSWKLADDGNHGNTDLDGPEPKMDKSQGPGPKPDVPGKIKEKDPTVPIGPMNNEHELQEIDGHGLKTEKLPANSGDAGFDDGRVNHGPHTDTFDNDGQVDPVTSEKQSRIFPPDPKKVDAAFKRLHQSGFNGLMNMIAPNLNKGVQQGEQAVNQAIQSPAAGMAENALGVNPQQVQQGVGQAENEIGQLMNPGNPSGHASQPSSQPAVPPGQNPDPSSNWQGGPMSSAEEQDRWDWINQHTQKPNQPLQGL